MPPAFPHYIDYNLLFDKHICLRAIHIFRRIFPDGFEVTPENILKAQNADLDVIWAAKSFLPIADWHWFVYVNLSPIEGIYTIKRERLESACEAIIQRSTELYYQVIDDTKGPIDPMVRSTTRTEALCRKESMDAQAEAVLKQGLAALDKEYRLECVRALIDFLELT